MMSGNSVVWSLYIHINKVNGKSYVGITSQKPKSRWKNGNGYKYNTHFFHAIQKYGLDSFIHIVIAQTEDEQLIKQCQVACIEIMDSCNPQHGYNITIGGEGHRKYSSIYQLEQANRVSQQKSSLKYREANKQKLREASRIYREANKQKIKEKLSDYRNVNRQKLREASRVYYQKNKQRIKHNSRNRYKENKQKIDQSHRRYYEANKQKIKERQRLYREKNKQMEKERQRLYYQKKKQQKALTNCQRKGCDS